MFKYWEFFSVFSCFLCFADQPPEPGMLIYGEIIKNKSPLTRSDLAEKITIDGKEYELKKAYTGRTIYTVYLDKTDASKRNITKVGADNINPAKQVDFMQSTSYRQEIIIGAAIPDAPVITASSVSQNVNDWTLKADVKWIPPANYQNQSPFVLIRWYVVQADNITGTHSFPELTHDGLTIQEMSIDNALHPKVIALAQRAEDVAAPNPVLADGGLVANSTINVTKEISNVKYIEVQICFVESDGTESVLASEIVPVTITGGQL